MHGIISLVIYFAVLALSALTTKLLFTIPHEVFRKVLHLILLGSIFVFVFCFDSWLIAAVSSELFALAVYPLLAWAEKKFKGYSSLLEQRKGGEIKTSLLIVFTMFTIVITVFWGLLGDRIMVLESVCAWGFGDAAAALIGKRFGRHKLEIKSLGVKKSWEGTLSMFTVSFISVFIILSVRGGFNPAGIIVTSAATAAVSAFTELVTTGGNDTITCPLAAMITLIPLTYLFGGGF